MFGARISTPAQHDLLGASVASVSVELWPPVQWLGHEPLKLCSQYAHDSQAQHWPMMSQ